MSANDTTKDLQLRLDQAEVALQRCERLSAATRYAAAVIHEVNNPLEAITNLVYLTRLQANDVPQVRENMKTIEVQLATLAQVTSQVLTFHRQQPCRKTFA